MMYLGNQAVGINYTNAINWNRLADGTLDLQQNVTLANSVTEIVPYAFRGFSIKNIEGPNVITIGHHSFHMTNKLEKAIFMQAENFGEYCLASSVVKYIIAPRAINIKADAFYQSSSLLGLDLGNSNITSGFVGERYTFEQAPTAITVFRYGYLIPAAENWFYTNCWMKKEGTPSTLYVWNRLISAYQNDTVWGALLSTNGNKILPIEGSIYENKYVDGTPIT